MHKKHKDKLAACHRNRNILRKNKKRNRNIIYSSIFQSPLGSTGDGFFWVLNLKVTLSGVVSADNVYPLKFVRLPLVR